MLACLVLLTLAATVAAVARFRPSGAAESVLGCAVVGNLLVLAPVLTLGYAALLTRGKVALATAALDAAVLALAAYDARREGMTPGAWLADTGAVARGMARGFSNLFRVPIVNRSAVLIGTVASVLIVLWLFVAVYYLPSDSWDGIQYHEPMVGFAIQNHALAPVRVPTDSGRAIDGFLQHSELTSLWFCILHDRRWVELPSVLAALPLFAATYLLTRRFSGAALALGWASMLLTVPGSLLQLRSTYIDVHTAAALLAALHFATRPTLRTGDAWLAALSIFVCLGLKWTLLPWALLLALVTLVRLVSRRREYAARDFASVLAGGTAVVLLGLHKYAANWVRLGSPFYPHDIALFKRDPTTGSIGLSEGVTYAKTFEDFIGRAASPYLPGRDFADTRTFGYGTLTIWLLLPLALLAFGWFVAVVGGRLARWALRRGGPPLSSADWLLLLAWLPLIASVKYTPSLDQARYNLHVIVLAMMTLAWFCKRYRAPRVAEPVAFACLITNLVMFAWSQPGQNTPPDAIFKAMTMSPAARSGAYRMRWMNPEFGALRERELGPGDVTVFSDDVGFIGPLWNEGYSNRVVYAPLRAPEDAAKDLDRLNAKWVIASVRSPVLHWLDSRESGYERVSQLWDPDLLPVYAYRRRPR